MDLYRHSFGEPPFTAVTAASLLWYATAQLDTGVFANYLPKKFLKLSWIGLRGYGKTNF